MTESLIPVESSVVAAIGWDNGTLLVEFRNGKVYPHPRVPYRVFEGLLNASSKGRYYNQNIRGRYK